MTTNKSSEDLKRNIQDNIIIWLDLKLKSFNEENQKFISLLRSAVNTIQTFSNLDESISFLKQIKNQNIFLIISDHFITQINSIEKQFTQLNSIYIFSHEKSKYDKIIKTNKKIQGIFNEMEYLIYKLIKEIRQLDDNFVPFGIIPPSFNDLNQLDPSFMYFQLLKENLLTIEYNHKTDIENLLEYRRSQPGHEKDDERLITDLEHKYHEKTPIWWYTMESFIYKTLNEALRNLDIDIMIKMGFFIRDLHEEIKKYHSEFHTTEKRLTVYRGQSMFNNDFEKLKNAKDGLFTFNCFLSTSTNRSTAEDFVRRCVNDDKKQVILFVIEIDPTISSVPFTPIGELSAVPSENEILFSMSTVFRIGEMKKNNQGIWEINLSLTSERDSLLKRLTDHMRNSLGNGDGWHRLGQLMIKMGHFDKAFEFYKILLKTVDLDDKAENAFLHNQLGYILKQKDQLKEAFAHYQEALKINQTYMSDTDPRMSSIYSNIGGILKKLGDANGALKYYELVLKIDLAAEKSNQLEIAIDHNNIGSVLDDQGKYSEALKSYEEALNIKLTHLPPHHPSLASTYSNIGLTHRKMGDYSTALAFYEKTLAIQTKSLPTNHPSFVVTYGKLATVSEDLHQYKDAVKYAEKAVNIATIAFGPTHPEVEKRRKYLQELEQKI